MKTVSKELFIMALLLMIVVFMIGMVFYEYMPNNKTVPEPITYTADSSTTAVLQEISSSTTTTDYGSTSEPESIIKSYSIGTKDIATAAAKQIIDSGKTDPFAPYTEPVSDGNTVGNTTNTTGNGGNTKPTNTNKDSNSTGTFFEKPNSK